MDKPSALTTLSGFLAPNQYVTSAAALVTYEIDAGLDRGVPQAVVFPQNVEQVVRLVNWAVEHQVPLVARGAGTGLSGGAVADRGGVIVEFSRLNRLIELDAIGRSAVVEPGILNLTLDEAAKKLGLYHPPDPASQRASTIGGNIGENAGGPHCFKYGVTTNYVTGLHVVRADGRAAHIGGRALDYPEYDFVGLIVGGEGTLALITSVEVRLVRNPPGVKTMMAVFDSIEHAGVAVSAVIAAGLVPATMEMMDRNITRIIEEYAHAGLPTDAEAVMIIEADGHPSSLDSQIEEIADILTDHGGRGLRIAQSAQERDRIWYARKSAAGAMSRLAPAYYLVDVTVPRSRLAEALNEVNAICSRYGVQAGHVFHAGDGNLHPLILIPNPEDPKAVEAAQNAGRDMVLIGVQKDGSLTGEHGVGIEKREYMPLMYSGAELAAMLDIKQAFDPQNRLNPGKVLPTKMPEVTKATGKGPLPGDPFTPTTAEQAAEGLAALSAARQPVCIGCRPPVVPMSPAISLSTAALSGVKTYAPDDLYITVGAGTRLDEIHSYLARDRKQVPLASPWQGATIGGLIASNLNAPLRMRYGSIRDLALAMTVALGDGRIIRAGRPVVKNVAGYDLPKVFVGSFGTLGLITDVTLKLTPLPRARRTLLVPVDDLPTALASAQQLLPLALSTSALLVIEQAALPQPISDSRYLIVCTAEGIREDVDTEFEQFQQVLKSRGLAASATVDTFTGTDLWSQTLGNAADALLVRVGLAPKDLVAYVQGQANLLIAGRFVVDIASGMLYATTLPADADAARAWVDALRRPAKESGGYAVVVHAPETLRGALDPWGYAPEMLDVMRGLKARWDPAGILNPGFFLVSPL